jgi:carboxylesterase type B
MFVNCPSTWLLQAVSERGQGNYKLIFNAGSQKHAATDAFLFSSGMNETISHHMRDWFISFALHSDPNKESWALKEGKPTWPNYGNKKTVLTINERDILVAEDEDIGERCKFWHRNSAITRNRIVIQ